MEEFEAASQNVDGGGLKNVMESMGLGMIANQVLSAVRVFVMRFHHCQIIQAL